MKNLYTLDAENNPVPATDPVEWALWHGHNDRHVKLTTLDEDRIEISTVFLGLAAAHPRGEPRGLFETMIFGGPLDMSQWRYDTWAEAETGHDEVVALVREKLEKKEN